MSKRTCRECAQDLPESEFGKTGLGRVLRWQCRTCYNLLSKTRDEARRRARGQKKFVPDKTRINKTCRICAVEKPVGEFHRRLSKGKWLGYDIYCKPCSKARTYAWRAKNPGGQARYQRAFRKKYPERVQRAADRWLEAHPTYERDRQRRRYADPKERARILAAAKRWAKRNPKLMLAYGSNYRHQKRANGGRGLTALEIIDTLSRPCFYCGGRSTTLDHVIPVSRGGKHEPENVVPACKSCNSSKGARTPEEWKTDARTRG